MTLSGKSLLLGIAIYSSPSFSQTSQLPTNPQFTVIADKSDGLAMPVDLAVNPNKPDELWVVNHIDDSAVIISGLGTDYQKSEKRIDPYGNHFMEQVSSIAFGSNGLFATCQASINTYDYTSLGNLYFMGPTLWNSDLNVFAKQPADQQKLGSHMDMLHQSPLCLGIAHESENTYWVFDSYHQHIVKYDFANDHGAGGHFHGDGKIVHYTGIGLNGIVFPAQYAQGNQITVPLRSPNGQTVDVPVTLPISAHMEFGANKDWLYIADTGNNRIIRLNVKSGQKGRDFLSLGHLEYEFDGKTYQEPIREQIAENYEINNSDVEKILDIKSPNAMAIHKGVLYTHSYENSEIVAIDIENEIGKVLGEISVGNRLISGLEVDSQGKIWAVDAANDELVRIDEK